MSSVHAIRGPGSNQYRDKAPLPPRDTTAVLESSPTAGVALSDPFGMCNEGDEVMGQWGPFAAHVPDDVDLADLELHVDRRANGDEDADVTREWRLPDGGTAVRVVTSENPGQTLLETIEVHPEARGRGWSSRILRGLHEENPNSLIVADNFLDAGARTVGKYVPHITHGIEQDDYDDFEDYADAVDDAADAALLRQQQLFGTRPPDVEHCSGCGGYGYDVAADPNDPSGQTPMQQQCGRCGGGGAQQVEPRPFNHVDPSDDVQF